MSVFTVASASRRLAGVAGGTLAGVVVVTWLLSGDRLPDGSDADTVKRYVRLGDSPVQVKLVWAEARVVPPASRTR